MPMPATTDPRDQANRIRQIFLEQKSTYSLSDLVRLTGITRYALTVGIKAGEYVAQRERRAYRFGWSELVHIAMAKWPLPVINDALGSDAARALPPLLLLEELRLRLPAYQVQMLRRLAELEAIDVDSYLSNYFLDLAGSEVKTLDAEIPGFKSAMRFPNGESHP
jgi:hypothetical protein